MVINLGCMVNAGSVEIVVISVYFGLLMCLGYVGFRKTKTFSDYILGSRKLGPVVGAMNVGASDMSSWILMGLPGAFYLLGMNQIWLVFGLIVGAFTSWTFIAKRLRKYTEIAGNSLTVSSFLENRFHDDTKILRIVTSVIIVIFFTIYIASGFVGSAKLFVEFFKINYTMALIISCVAVISYAFLGGFLAISWADLFQGTLMLFALIIIPCAMFANLDFNTIKTTLAENKAYINPFSGITFASIIGIFAWGIGYVGQPHIISKYMAIKDPNKINTARNVCISWMVISLIGASLIGIIGFVYFKNSPLNEPEAIFITSASTLFSPIIIGVLISALLSAIMSTINAQIIICCSALAEDVYHRFFRKNAKDTEMLLITKLFVILIAIISVVMASNQNSSVLQLVARAWAGLGASIGPVIVFALFWKKTTKAGAVAGVVFGAFSALFLSCVKWFSYEILPSFLISCIVIYVVSKFTKQLNQEQIEREFEYIKN